MYIDRFIAGILVTIMSECIIVIAGAIITSYKKKVNLGGHKNGKNRIN